jgi:glycosyltransferase involved in cell wall biosynthesis
MYDARGGWQGESVTQPKVTIAIPTYTRSRTLTRAVNSALGQTYEDIEVLVCDDCSTDDTQEVLESYSDPRLRVWRHEANVGIFANVNECVRGANGEYFLLLMDDDYLESHCIESLLTIWEREHGIAFVYGQYWLDSDSGSVLMRGDAPDQEEGFRFIKGWWAGKRPCFINTVLFRTERVRGVGGFHPIYAFDVYLIHRLALEGVVAHVPRPVSHYVEHSGTVSNTRVRWQDVLWDREAVFEMCVAEGIRRGISARDLAELRKTVRRSQAIVAAGGLLRAAESTDSICEMARLAWQLRGVWRHNLLVSGPAVASAVFLPRALREGVRKTVRKLGKASHLSEIVRA